MVDVQAQEWVKALLETNEAANIMEEAVDQFREKPEDFHRFSELCGTFLRESLDNFWDAVAEVSDDGNS